jgi:Holliday junction resolvase RusA-like endonuclease
MNGPRHYVEVLSVHVAGTPKPQGSKRAFVVPAKGDRKARAIVVDADSAGHGKGRGPHADWRSTVTVRVQEAMDVLPGDDDPDRQPWRLTGPLAVRLVFALPRPASAPKTRRTWPSGRVGDIDKLARSVLDSMTDAGVWHDDAQVVHLDVTKDYPGPDIRQTVPGVRITVHHIREANR